MTKPTIRIHNTETDEVIDREMTAAEIADFEAVNAKIEADRAEAIAKAEQKSALLERLGITEEEAALLLS